ncbi:MAG: Asp-tRNA(Asn) amidotransferase GatCAB subunit C [Hadesarchaea archaeon]|nr:Asp-tRNA(Asn) amidotransferase GatCAB subunit C [Hadesarchaea archaeon]MDH5685098.1 Asp-tRNA(Asn) amidotransferase GatCAB subunit C [Hadesarchaea archaeon]
MAERKKEIERSAEEIVESFARAAEGLPKLKETYYNQETCNVSRPDGEPSSEEERTEFRKRFISIMPGSDEKGNLRVEVAKWVEER